MVFFEFSRIPFKISTVSLALGSLTSTSLNLRVNAASLRILFRYSSCVVAPIIEISPRLNAGFKISDNPLLPESLPVAPEPIIWWISSKNNTAFCEDLTPSINFWIFSSKAPRYCVPASNDEISTEIISLSLIAAGTFPSTIACAKPSTIAVLPTPASPTNIGLF